MTIYILEKSVMGGARHLLASDVFMFLQNASRKVSDLIYNDIIYLWKRVSPWNLLLYTSSP